MSTDGEQAVTEKDNAVVPPLPAYSEEGVDMTQIRWMLSLTPVERLRVGQQHAEAAWRLQHGIRKIRLHSPVEPAESP